MPPGRTERSAFSNVALLTERFDRHVGAAAGQSLDLADDVLLLEVEHDVGAHALRGLESARDAVDRDDEGSTRKASAGQCTESNWTRSEHGDRIADPHWQPSIVLPNASRRALGSHPRHDPCAEHLDSSHGLMADDETRLQWVFTA